MGLMQCSACQGSGRRMVRRASRRTGEGDEVVSEDCKTCDGAGQLESPPAA